MSFVLVAVVDGVARPTPEGIGILFGVSADLINPEIPMRPEWLDAGRRRAEEAAAATGTEDVFAALEYWAQKDFGAAVRLRDDVAILVSGDSSAPHGWVYDRWLHGGLVLLERFANGLR